MPHISHDTTSTQAEAKHAQMLQHEPTQLSLTQMPYSDAKPAMTPQAEAKHAQMLQHEPTLNQVSNKCHTLAMIPQDHKQKPDTLRCYNTNQLSTKSQTNATH